MEKNNLENDNHANLTARKIVYYIFGVLEVLLAFRLFFKILGANYQSTFVAMIYSVTKVFLTPFTGIFRMAVSKGIETQSVFEPTVIIAMIVYALLAWGIVKIIWIARKHKGSETL